MTAQIEQLLELPLADLSPLVGESEAEGLGYVRRMADEWAAGVNRFRQPGEALFAARVEGVLVGVCGLTIDPHAGSPRIGRVRRLYIRTSYRRRGIGRRLVEAVLRAAMGVFDSLRLRTDNPEAARFYEGLGFHPCPGETDCTHGLALKMIHCQSK
jgi:ribosomal protein S18 acetylase RimI-like enzyme